MTPKGSARLIALAAGVASLALAVPSANATPSHTLVHQANQAVTGSESHRLQVFGHGSKSTNYESTNWSGYAKDGGSYTSVSSAWTQPTISCTSTNTYSSFWVGLDGFSNSALEQTGTEADCINGSAHYGAWWEVLPAAESAYSGVTVRGGDHMSASVVYNGGTSFTMTLTDSTQGWTKTTTHAGSSGFQNTSAEVIAEATSVGGSIANLSKFGTVNFSSSKVNGSTMSTGDEITMVGGDTGNVIAQPSGLSSGAFSVTWKGYN
jgi:hypothetical protein